MSIHKQSLGPPPFTPERPSLGVPPFVPVVTTPGIEMPSSAMAVVGISKTKIEYHCDELEKRLKAIEGTRTSNTTRPSDYCLVHNVVLPPKFKMPEFEKFDGTTYPQTHMRLFFKSIASYADNEKLMMYCFQSGLTRAAARWYVQQDRARICTWGDLADDFEEQYRHVMEMAPNRITLFKMEKKPTETFREYAYRWRDAVIQVDPPIGDREAIMLFINTLKDLYHRNLLGATPHDFMDVVAARGRIDANIKVGRV
ncbi:uncharacterized protein LOC131150232 [Malania oleifera]|uniref:uncharacterized protein LOC131150232 n=1 Tax=Malania oleifera TaxID=397392 RepID=UPI0025AEB829|nr:uncharacterized protein LOC131150232 [Malania oleifera]